MHVDEFIDELLHAERVCDIILPRLQVRLYHISSHMRCPSCVQHVCLCVCVLQKRHVLEETEMMDPRISALEEDLDEVESSEEEDEEEEKVGLTYKLQVTIFGGSVMSVTLLMFMYSFCLQMN